MPDTFFLQGQVEIWFRSNALKIAYLEKCYKYKQCVVPCPPDEWCWYCEATPCIRPPPTCDWHAPRCPEGRICFLCPAAPKVPHTIPPHPLGEWDSDASVPSRPTSPEPTHTYSLTSPCPGEGLGDSFENCPPNNWCNGCMKCKVCDPCFAPCPEAEYIGLQQAPSKTPRPSPEAASAPSPPRNCAPNRYAHPETDKWVTVEAQRVAAHRKRETPEEHEARLQKDREYRKKKTEGASDKEREAKRKYEADRKRERLARETKEEKEARLQKRRESRARSLNKEPPLEKKALRTGDDIREYERKQKKKQLARETSEQREARLKKMREYSASRRGKKEMKVSPQVKDSTKERMRAIRANWTEEEKVQDRLKAKERMNRVRQARTLGKSLEEDDPENIK